MAVQRQAPEGTPYMHEQEFVRGKGKFFLELATPGRTNKSSR